ncbi:MAG: mechanosensitive ion channel family protein [Bacillaceae bacterium]
MEMRQGGKQILKQFKENILAKILNPDLWEIIFWGSIRILLIIIIAQFIVRLGKRLVKKVMKINSRTPLHISERRTVTLQKLIENIWGYVVYFIAGMMILDFLGVPIASIIAGAGIIGVAVGFGAQSLVKDVITGFFIIFEDQFAVGDYVRLNTTNNNQGVFEGTIIEIGLRTSKLRSLTGEVHIIPNGNITNVTNSSIYNNFAIVDFGIAYEGDIERAEKVIMDLLETLPEKYEELVGVPQLLGVQALGASEVTLRVIAETEPMKHFPIMRALRKEIKVKLDEEGIEIPFPRMVMYNRVEQGK